MSCHLNTAFNTSCITYWTNIPITCVCLILCTYKFKWNRRNAFRLYDVMVLSHRPLYATSVENTTTWRHIFTTRLLQRHQSRCIQVFDVVLFVLCARSTTYIHVICHCVSLVSPVHCRSERTYRHFSWEHMTSRTNVEGWTAQWYKKYDVYRATLHTVSKCADEWIPRRHPSNVVETWRHNRDVNIQHATSQTNEMTKKWRYVTRDRLSTILHRI